MGVRPALVVCLSAAAVGLLAIISGAAEAPAANGDRQCPARDNQPIVSTRPAAQARLVPAGARDVILCSYSGVDPVGHRSFALVAQRLVARRATVHRLAAEMNGLRVLTGTYSCPASTGAAVVAFFRYRSLSPDPVTVQLDGCALVTNGHITRAALRPPGPRLLRQLRSLTAARK